MWGGGRVWLFRGQRQYCWCGVSQLKGDVDKRIAGQRVGFMVEQGRELTIVVAEDEPVTLEILMRSLRKRGWVVYGASDGEKAEAMILEHRPQVALLDVHLPFRSGFELLKLAKEKLGREIHVVMVTATGQEFDRQRAFELGADSYVVKPVDVRGLPTLIESLV